MALVQNYSINFRSCLKQIGGGYGEATGVGTNASNNLNRFANTSMLPRCPVPTGYSPGQGAWLPQKTSGGIGMSYSSSGVGGRHWVNLAGGKNASTSISKCKGTGTISTALGKLFGALASSNIQGFGGFQSDPDMFGVLNAIATIVGTGSVSSADAQAVLALVANMHVGGSGSISDADFTAFADMMGHIYVNQSQATVDQITAGVWDALAADHNNAGTMGNKMNAAGAAGDPWSALTSTQTVPGTMGKTVVDTNNRTKTLVALSLGG